MKNLEEKIEDIKKISNDDAEYIESIYKFYSKKEILEDSSRIIEESNLINRREDAIIINTKELLNSPIWNTVMRRKISGIMEKIKKEDQFDAKTVRRILKNIKSEKTDGGKNHKLDMLINNIKEQAKKNKNFEVFYLKNNFTDEEIFLINELNKLIDIIKQGNNIYESVYDAVCKNLDESFSVYNFCNFKNDKCVSQRHKGILNDYPNQKKDGCCFNTYRKCKLHNTNGSCKTTCIACKLFTCPYLTKRGTGLYTTEILLIRAFLNDKQKKDAVWTFFTNREDVIKRIEKHKNV